MSDMNRKYEIYPTATLETNIMPFNYSPNYALIMSNEKSNKIFSEIHEINNINKKEELKELLLQSLNENVSQIDVEKLVSYFDGLSENSLNERDDVGDIINAVFNVDAEKIKRKETDRPKLTFRPAPPADKEKKKLKPHL